VDFDMPGIDGAEFCRRITQLKRESGSAAAIMVLTSHDDKEHVTRALEAGADDCIGKSADFAVVKARLRALLRRKFFVQENRRILDEMREKEVRAERARAEKDAAELRATMADRLADANRELQSANLKLEEALNVTRAITENAAEALLMLDAKGLVSFANPAAECLFGYSFEELLGLGLAGKLVPAGADDPIARCLKDGVTIRGADGVFVSKAGARVDVACSYAPIVRNGAVRAVVVVLHDVSERKRAEERLREAQKLESVALLAGGVAHDFNNLLTGILGNASLAADLLPEDSPALEVLQGVVSAGERAADLTRQMLAYSGKGRFLVERVDLSKLCAEMLRLLRSSISKNVALESDLSRALPAVEADPGQMQQVIMNLVLNAAEAIGDQPGTVWVRTRLSTMDETFRATAAQRSDTMHDLYVLLSVRDTGAGMDEATQRRIFDPFFSTKFVGRGLGLAAVSGIVRSHGGAIRVVSAPGQGAIFEVLFPATYATTEHRKAASEPVGYGFDSDPVLIIDDEEIVRRTASSTLMRRGYRVRVASDGKEGVGVLRAEKCRISLVILDVTMPGMSGLETLREIRKVAPHLKVLISSGYGEEQTMSMFTGHEVSGFIQKPYSTERLLDKVARSLHSSPA
jgi:PAS domain S-box-containing protein